MGGRLPGRLCLLFTFQGMLLGCLRLALRLLSRAGCQLCLILGLVRGILRPTGRCLTFVGGLVGRLRIALGRLSCSRGLLGMLVGVIRVLRGGLIALLCRLLGVLGSLRSIIAAIRCGTRTLRLLIRDVKGFGNAFGHIVLLKLVVVDAVAIVCLWLLGLISLAGSLVNALAGAFSSLYEKLMDVQPLTEALYAVPQALEDLARGLERGQAATPLQDAARGVAASLRLRPELTLILVGVTPAARATALTWLMGPQQSKVQVKLSEPLSWLEIRLQEQGYTITSETAQPDDYSDASLFLQAINQRLSAAGVDAGLLEPLRIGLQAPPPLRNMTLLVPADVGLVATEPGLFRSIAERLGVLVVAAPADQAWEAVQVETLSLLARNALAVWPVLTGPAAGPGRTLQTLTEALPAPVLPLIHLENAQSAFIPDFIVAGPGHPLRHALGLQGLQRRCRGVLDMVAERFETDLRQLESRHLRETRLERASDAASRAVDVKLTVDQYRSRLADELTRVLQALREKGRKSLLRSGEVGQCVEHFLASLHGDDLERELTRKHVRLLLKPEVLAGFQKRLVRVLRQQVSEDCVLLRDAMEQLRQQAGPVLSEIGATARNLSLTAPDDRALAEGIDETLVLDLRYRGELPRRGFWQRLAEGRRIVFVAMMLLSLVGGFVGFNIRQAGAFGVVLLALFIGAVIYTYMAWRKDEAEQVDKEIEKVREALRTELSRTLSELLRDRLARLQQVVDDGKKEGFAQLDQALRYAQDQKAQRVERDRRDAKTKLRAIEAKLKELRPLGPEIGKLRERIDQLGLEAGALTARVARMGGEGL
ncbi:hypothetical protein ACW73L_11340 [Methylolobus aquaticus]